MCIGDCKCIKHMQRFDLPFQFSVSQLQSNRKKTKWLQRVNHVISQITTCIWDWISLYKCFFFKITSWLFIATRSTNKDTLYQITGTPLFVRPFLSFRPILDALPPHVPEVLWSPFRGQRLPPGPFDTFNAWLMIQRMHDGIVGRMEIKIDHGSFLFCFFFYPSAAAAFRLDRDPVFSFCSTVIYVCRKWSVETWRNWDVEEKFSVVE